MGSLRVIEVEDVAVLPVVLATSMLAGTGAVEQSANRRPHPGGQ